MNRYSSELNENGAPATIGTFSKQRCCRTLLANGRLIREQETGEAPDAYKLERVGSHEVHFDRKSATSLGSQAPV